MLRISEAATYLGVSPASLRRWEHRGLLCSLRTPGNHRRYTLDTLKHIYYPKAKELLGIPPQRRSLCYGRVSGHKQKEKGDLQRQMDRLYNYVIRTEEHSPIMLSDVGSGLNPKRTGLNRLLRHVRQGEISRVVVTYQDRLTRFGFPFLQADCGLFHVPIVQIASGNEKTSLQHTLVEDMMALIACFSGKLYGMRSVRCRQQTASVTKEQQYSDRFIQEHIERTERRLISWCLHQDSIKS